MTVTSETTTLWGRMIIAADYGTRREWAERRVVVTIATYRRPQGLRRLLDSLDSQDASVPIEVVVVDNDPSGSALGVVSNHSLGIHYVHEPVPGIAAARNAGVRVALALAPSHIAFIDDDEVADIRWIRSLVNVLTSHDAAAAIGPVLCELPPGCPWWIRRYAFFERPRQVTGDDVRWPATNNALVSAEVFIELWPNWFDEAFSLTGGEDAELFSRIRERGHRIIWADEAVVTEIVPESRAGFRWLWRRGIRLGNVSARLRLRRQSRLGVCALAIGRLAYGATLGVLSLLTSNRRGSSTIMHLPKGVGMLQAVRGNLLVEYKRESN